jgi:catechol 2,3-dioxygenase-like lactoylglutathione lyase family enzyme
MIQYEDISHLAMEVTDVDRAEEFYTKALGMEVICRDEGELGQGRLTLKNERGQFLFLEKVDKLSQRSRFCGPDVQKVPDAGEGFRYKGAHLAMSVGSVEEYDEIYNRLEANGAYLEGDLRAAHRKPGEKSVYFYDPFGNRLQLIILPLASR